MIYKVLLSTSVIVAVGFGATAHTLIRAYAPDLYGEIDLFASINIFGRFSVFASLAFGIAAVAGGMFFRRSSKFMTNETLVYLQTGLLLVSLASEGYGVAYAYATVANIIFDVSALAFAALALVVSAHATSFGLTWLALWMDAKFANPASRVAS